jgi:hypothetical protein
MNYEKLRTTKRQFKDLTSLSVSDFDRLLPLFTREWESYITHFTLDGLPRVYPYEAKNAEQLPTPESKLFFILFYKKIHCIQPALATIFDLDIGMANRWIHILTPILEKSLADYKVKEDLSAVDFSTVEEAIIDGTERPIQRDTYHQEDTYSGKKKTHTVKNLLIVSSLGVILWLGQTVAGKIHDKKLAQQLEFNQCTLHTAGIPLLADLAFLAWKSQNVKLILPYKKPRNTKTEKRYLSEQQKDENKQLASRRVKVENVLAHIKIWRIVKERNRNYKLGFRATIIRIACALHNFKNAEKIVQKKEKIC